jgi:hypothetical protein
MRFEKNASQISQVIVCALLNLFDRFPQHYQDMLLQSLRQKINYTLVFEKFSTPNQRGTQLLLKRIMIPISRRGQHGKTKSIGS